MILIHKFTDKNHHSSHFSHATHPRAPFVAVRFSNLKPCALVEIEVNKPLKYYDLSTTLIVISISNYSLIKMSFLEVELKIKHH